VLRVVHGPHPGGDGGDRVRLATELRNRGLSHVVIWPRGVDAGLFHPVAPSTSGCRARVPVRRPLAVEKNRSVSISKLDLPGSKVIVGDGRPAPPWSGDYPQAIFVGALAMCEARAQAYAGSDLFARVPIQDPTTAAWCCWRALASRVPGCRVSLSPGPPRTWIGTAPFAPLNED